MKNSSGRVQVAKKVRVGSGSGYSSNPASKPVQEYLYILRCVVLVSRSSLVLRAVPGRKEFVTFKFYDFYLNILYVSQTFCNISSAKNWCQKYRQIIVIRLKVWFSQPLCLDRNPLWLLNYNKAYLICVSWAFTIVHFVWLWLFSLLQHSIQKINLTHNWKTIYEF